LTSATTGSPAPPKTRKRAETARLSDGGGIWKGGAEKWRQECRHSLFPLDACGGLGGDVVEHAVDAFDFVENLVAGLAQDDGGQLHPVGGHRVFGDDGAEVGRPFVAAFVAFDAHGFHRDQSGVGLPDFVIPTVLLELADEDGVALADDVEALLVDDPRAADG